MVGHIQLFVWGLACCSLVHVGRAEAAKRREGPQGESVLAVDLPCCVVFGDKRIAGKHYRLTVGSGGLTLADPSTMVVVAKLKAAEETLAQAVAEPTIQVQRKGSAVTLVVTYVDHRLTVQGQACPEGREEADESLVQLAAKNETRVVTQKRAEDRTDEALVGKAVKRYFGSIKHCKDKVHKNRWGTDDPRFYNCVCPIAERWRLPRVSKPLLYHHPLAVGRSGFSLKVEVDGKVSHCRVWVGSAPPPEPKETPAEGAEAPAKKGQESKP